MTPKQIEAAADAVYDFVMPNQEQLAVLIHASGSIDGGKQMSDRLAAVLAICAEIARAALAAAEAKAWCSMESAPRDGTHILVWWPYWAPTRPITVRWSERLGDWAGDDVLSSAGDGPTHWRLPPAPPEAG